LTRTVPTVSVRAMSFPSVPPISAVRVAYDSVLATPSDAMSPYMPIVFVKLDPNVTFEVSVVPLIASF